MIEYLFATTLAVGSVVLATISLGEMSDKSTEHSYMITIPKKMLQGFSGPLFDGNEKVGSYCKNNRGFNNENVSIKKNDPDAKMSEYLLDYIELKISEDKQTYTGTTTNKKTADWLNNTDNYSTSTNTNSKNTSDSSNSIDAKIKEKIQRAHQHMNPTI